MSFVALEPQASVSRLLCGSYRLLHRLMDGVLDAAHRIAASAVLQASVIFK